LCKNYDTFDSLMIRKVKRTAFINYKLLLSVTFDHLLLILKLNVEINIRMLNDVQVLHISSL